MGALGMLIKVAFVFGLLFVTLRVVGKLYNGGGAKIMGGRHEGAVIQVIGRQSIGRNADVTVVTLGERTLVLGVTEHNVSMVAELDPEEMVTREVIDIPPAMVAAVASPLAIPARTQAQASVPSWRDLLESMRERTVRR
ncbi:MAG: flagellar biosynthetic protein FliO [Acidimicrobiales bacterium]|nr:flagellar biosynthetic protein FliO [Acidimicrobiales bacterium]